MSTLFQKYPLLSYTSNGVTKPIVDITRRAIIVSKFKEESAAFVTYTIADGERPEDVSLKFYGTPNYHWIILAYNDIVDPYYDWPMSQTQLDAFLSIKFAQDGVSGSDVRQVETDDGVVLASVDGVLINYLQLTGAVTIPDEFGDIVIIGDGTLFKTEIQVGDVIRVNSETSVVVSIESDTHLTVQTPMTLPASNFGSAIYKQVAINGNRITYYDYEVRENDRKREIFIPSIDVVQRIDSEFTQVLKV